MARTKECDPDAALQSALELFWRRGYEATSMAGLVEHLGIGRASIYRNPRAPARMLLVLLQGVVEAEVVEGGRRAGPGLREDLAVREGAVLPYVEGAADETCPGVGFAALPEILEAHVIAGSASMLVKVRTATTEQLQDVLRRIHAIDGVNGTRATVVLETLFERPVSPRAAGQE